MAGIDPVAAIDRIAGEEPERIAVVTPAGSHSFEMLRRDSTELAGRLARSGLRPGDIAVVQGERSYEAVVAMTAVLRVGSGYLMLDPRAPGGRTARMLRAAKPKAQIRLHPGERRWSVEAAQGEAARAGELASDLGYVVFTSGTSGEPKGVMISRDSLGWLCDAIARAYSLRPGDRVLHSSSLSFDVAAEEIWPTLSAGSCLAILGSALGEQDYARFTQFLRAHAISVANLPSSYFAGWARHLEVGSEAVPESLRLVIAGSEPLHSEAARRWLGGPAGNIALFNAYGVSEATVTSIAGRVATVNTPEHGTAPLGAPLDDVIIKIASTGGEPGELFLSGPGLAIGYLDDSALTHSRFTCDEAGRRWYRTGDIVRNDKSVLSFVGRADDQLKVGGHRVEPEEIASAIVAVSSAVDARVFLISGKLVACTLGSLGLRRDQLADALKGRLPAYMIPDHVHELKEFPLTAGGKVDQAELQATLRSLMDSKLAEEARQTSAKLDLASLLEICRTVLGTTEVTATSNFFDAGGTSLMAARLVAELFRRFQIVVPLDSVFSYPRLDQLAEHITQIAVGT